MDGRPIEPRQSAVADISGEQQAPSARPIRLALVGAGAMGEHHARVAMGLRDAHLTAVVDPEPQRGQQIAERVGCRYHPVLASVLGEIDAAIVATPTTLHHSVTMELLSAGIHVLVEKPLSSNPDEAREMIDLSKRANRALMVGHIERFNPAVLELETLIDEPIHVTAERISPYTPRILDGVTLDLMIHDLDLVASLAQAPVRRLAAISQDVRGSDDLAVAVIEFETGLTASITASRLGQDKVRRITITQRENFIRLDLIRQSITIHRLGRVDQTEGEAGYQQSGVVEVPFLRHRGEPLLLELGHFIDCIRDGRIPRVSGEDGLRAIELVEMVRRQAAASLTAGATK